MNKPFKGVISHWHFSEGRIHGLCVHHVSYENGVERGQKMTTSPVERIVMSNGALQCVTKNSIYVLL